jgi:hypothetical protein
VVAEEVVIEDTLVVEIAAATISIPFCSGQEQFPFCRIYSQNQYQLWHSCRFLLHPVPK